MTQWCRKCLADIIAHSLEDKPREACGLLIEHGDKICSRRCRNDSPYEDAFELCAADHMTLFNKYKVVGTYHSHPKGKAFPSEGDLELFPPDPTWLHAIVGMGNGEIIIRAFKPDGDQVDITISN